MILQVVWAPVAAMPIHDTSGNMVTLDSYAQAFGGRRVGKIGYEGFRSHSEGGIIAILEGCGTMTFHGRNKMTCEKYDGLPETNSKSPLENRPKAKEGNLTCLEKNEKSSPNGGKKNGDSLG